LSDKICQILKLFDLSIKQFLEIIKEKNRFSNKENQNQKVSFNFFSSSLIYFLGWWSKAYKISGDSHKL